MASARSACRRVLCRGVYILLVVVAMKLSSQVGRYFWIKQFLSFIIIIIQDGYKTKDAQFEKVCEVWNPCGRKAVTDVVIGTLQQGPWRCQVQKQTLNCEWPAAKLLNNLFAYYICNYVDSTRTDGQDVLESAKKISLRDSNDCRILPFLLSGDVFVKLLELIFNFN